MDVDDNEDADAAALGIGVKEGVEAKVRPCPHSCSCSHHRTVSLSLSFYVSRRAPLTVHRLLAEHQVFNLQQDIPKYRLGQLPRRKEWT